MVSSEVTNGSCLVDPPSIDSPWPVPGLEDSCFCFRVDGMAMKRIRLLVTNRHTDIIKPDDPVQLPHQRAQIVPVDLDTFRSHSIPRRAIHIGRRLKAETRL